MPKAAREGSYETYVYVGEKGGQLKLVMPPEEMFWGDRYGQVKDPFGYLWSVATHTRDVTPDEMREAMSKLAAPR